jgi:hypothetical protein
VQKVQRRAKNTLNQNKHSMHILVPPSGTFFTLQGINGMHGADIFSFPIQSRSCGHQLHQGIDRSKQTISDHDERNVMQAESLCFPTPIAAVFNLCKKRGSPNLEVVLKLKKSVSQFERREGTKCEPLDSLFQCVSVHHFLFLPAFSVPFTVFFLERQMLSIRHGALAVSGSVMRIGELHS